MQIDTRAKSGGKRVTGDKNRGGGRPLFTVVTVVFNGANDLKRTIQSVLQQSFTDFEYILIDGGSSDGTLDILQSHEQEISLWISEPDRGVYDAFNKAVRLGTGEWTVFLGAGDVFHDPRVLEHVAEATRTVDASTELIYGKVSIIDSKNKPMKTLNRPWGQMRGRWLGGRPVFPHHQGVFHRRNLLTTKEPFDIRYRIAADSKLIYASVQRVQPFFSDVIVASVALGGISTEPKYFMTGANEILKINREFGFGHCGHQLWFYLKVVSKYSIFRLAGDGASKFCIDKYRQMTGREPKWSR
jgi:glycosyltransferase involved in cell wall biosynthesis